MKLIKRKLNEQTNKLIKEHFFVFDSNHLEEVDSHMYGFAVSKKGIITDNYYKQIGQYEVPEPMGVYIMIRKVGNELILNQDFYGSFGLYLYENKDKDYFALSNSFLLLEDYLVGHHNLSFNKDFADHLIISNLCPYSVYETLIKEIIQIPSNSFIVINIIRKEKKIYYIDYQENSIPLESEEGLKIIDNWIDKWGYILRSLKKKTKNISYDLSGGFDTRTLLPILLKSGINLNDILINSIKNKEHGHDEDLKIATDIASKLGFKLNNFHLDTNFKKWGIKNTFFCTIYSKLGFHKEFYFKNGFLTKPKFSFTGSGGESLRGVPGIPIKQNMEQISYQKITNHDEEFYNSSTRLLNRTLDLLKTNKYFNNDYEISSHLYSIAIGKNHFGKAALESFIANIYFLQPLMDPDLKKIKYNIHGDLSHDLIAYIYIRFAHELINFPFQGNRTLNSESITKANQLNNNFTPYTIKTDYNQNFYIDNKRKIPEDSEKDEINVDEYLKKLFNSNQYVNLINKIYDNKVIKWAKENIIKSNYFPFRHEYGLLAISLTIENLLFNERYLNFPGNTNKFKKQIKNSFKI